MPVRSKSAWFQEQPVREHCWLCCREDSPSSKRLRSRCDLMGFKDAMAAIFAFAAFGQGVTEQPREILDRAAADFEHGRIAQAVAGFDRVAKLAPGYAPQLWQRGIALYYAGRYKDCRAQFESHRTVNPDDVENAAWHFLCVARAESPERARAALLPVGPDPRVPLPQIYQMFRGTLAPETVLAAAGDRPASQFYAHLYLGLYFDALG